MVGAVVVLFLVNAVAGWCFNHYANEQRAEMAAVKAENLRLARAILALEKLIQDDWKIERANPEQVEDHEARIAFCESRLTPKPSEAKIVPRPHKTTFRKFAEAASKATEEIEA